VLSAPRCPSARVFNHLTTAACCSRRCHQHIQGGGSIATCQQRRCTSAHAPVQSASCCPSAEPSAAALQLQCAQLSASPQVDVQERLLTCAVNLTLSICQFPQPPTTSSLLQWALLCARLQAVGQQRLVNSSCARAPTHLCGQPHVVHPQYNPLQDSSQLQCA
jgi:hypothetical protein